MSKYNFKKLKNEKVKLPDDCNLCAIEIAEKFKSEKLKKAITNLQNHTDENGKRDMYGQLVFYDKKQQVRALFEFCAGICINIKLVKDIDEDIEFHMNIKNKRLIFKEDGN